MRIWLCWYFSPLCHLCVWFLIWYNIELHLSLQIHIDISNIPNPLWENWKGTLSGAKSGAYPGTSIWNKYFYTCYSRAHWMNHCHLCELLWRIWSARVFQRLSLAEYKYYLSSIKAPRRGNQKPSQDAMTETSGMWSRTVRREIIDTCGSALDPRPHRIQVLRNSSTAKYSRIQVLPQCPLRNSSIASSPLNLGKLMNKLQLRLKEKS